MIETPVLIAAVIVGFLATTTAALLSLGGKQEPANVASLVIAVVLGVALVGEATAAAIL